LPAFYNEVGKVPVWQMIFVGEFPNRWQVVFACLQQFAGRSFLPAVVRMILAGKQVNYFSV